jgi:hypothetical protein
MKTLFILFFIIFISIGKVYTSSVHESVGEYKTDGVTITAVHETITSYPVKTCTGKINQPTFINSHLLLRAESDVIILDAYVVVKGKKYLFQGQPALDKNSFQNSNTITIRDKFINGFTIAMKIKNKKASDDSIMVLKKKLKIKLGRGMRKWDTLNIVEDN